MAKKKVLNVGKIMVLSGAVIILVLVALWCGSLLKLTHEQKNFDPNAVTTQSTISVNVIVPPTTTTVTVATEPPQTTTITEPPTDENVTSELTVKGNGEFQEYIIKLANPALDIHSEPSYNSMITGSITDRGSYTITKETIDDDGNKWGLVDIETSFGWINLIDARKADPNDVGSATESTTENNNNTDDTLHNNNSYGGDGNLTGIDADGDGWDDGFNPDAWCIICGYDSYWSNEDGCYYCSQGHIWNY